VPDEEGACLVVAINDQSVFIDSGCDYPFDEIKPILRTLEDLVDCEKELLWHETGQEIIKFDILNMSYKVVHNPRATLMLLRFGIDIFGLIENGLAIRADVQNSYLVFKFVCVQRLNFRSLISPTAQSPTVGGN
jgi:hypothetical protein